MNDMIINLGDYQSAFEQAMQQAETDDLVARIWERDHSVWAPQPEEISNRLGWLDIAERMGAEIPDLQAFTQGVIASGIDKVLVLGMGGSSLAPEVLAKIIGPAQGYATLEILDSTDPQVVREHSQRFPPESSLYIVSTKSGGTVETLSFFKHFYNLAQAALGADQAGSRFAAITDPGSKLVDLAERYGFRRSFLNDATIGGRYSALSLVGLVPAALLGLDLEKLLARAASMAAHCRAPAAENPGVRLGMALAELAKGGRDKLTFRSPEQLLPFGDWAEQLIAESTGKSGTGILPVVDEPVADRYGQDRFFAYLGETGSEQPSLTCAWQDEYDLGGQFFLWEFATAVAGNRLGIHPFNQPNVETAKQQARQLTDQYIQSGELPKADSQAPSEAALRGFLAKAEASDYIALQAFLAPGLETDQALGTMRQALRQQTGLATTLGYGPRFLHSTGQLHKGDGGNGLFIQFLTAPPEEDLPIPLEAGQPESEISFGVLKAAQALGDAEALRAAGRRVITFELDKPVDQITSLAEGFHG